MRADSSLRYERKGKVASGLDLVELASSARMVGSSEGNARLFFDGLLDLDHLQAFDTLHAQ